MLRVNCSQLQLQMLTRIDAAYRQRDATPELLQSIQLEVLYGSLCVIQQIFLLGDNVRNRTAQIARVIARHYYHYCYHLSEKNMQARVVYYTVVGKINARVHF